MNECPECGSNKIVKNAILQDIANYAEIPQRVSVDQKPEAWVFRERVHANSELRFAASVNLFSPMQPNRRSSGLLINRRIPM